MKKTLQEWLETVRWLPVRATDSAPPDVTHVGVLRLGRYDFRLFRGTTVFLADDLQRWFDV